MALKPPRLRPMRIQRACKNNYKLMTTTTEGSCALQVETFLSNKIQNKEKEGRETATGCCQGCSGSRCTWGLQNMFQLTLFWFRLVFAAEETEITQGNVTGGEIIEKGGKTKMTRQSISNTHKQDCLKKKLFLICI